MRLKYITVLFHLLIGLTMTADSHAHEKKTSHNRFTTEQQLPARLINEIAHFWQQGTFSQFNGVNNVRINYAFFKQPNSHSNKNSNSNPPNKNAHKCLVIVNGRSESYLKYKELSFDLFQQGYNLFLIDHRGQGLSQRLLDNSHKGYVESFDDYVNDLANFIDDIVQPHCTDKPYILAHSMGGAITIRYLQRFPNTIKAAVLSSPMIAINSGGVPHSIATALIKSSEQMNQWLSDDQWYFFGHENYKPTAFADNKLMHSKIRYQYHLELFQQQPSIQLGGVTVKWLVEAISAQQAIFADIDKITTPLLILQAGNELIVDNQAQNEFCQLLHKKAPQSCPTGKPIVIEGAYHELFFESDDIRNSAIDHTLAWFEKYKNE